MQVTLDEAKTDLSALLDAVATGEQVVITRDSEFAVQLVPYRTVKHKPRFGSAKGLITILPGFDDPLEELDEYSR